MGHAQSGDPFGLVGSVLDRQFRVDALVGQGGFGVVYRGWHLTLDQPVAIKALKMPDARDAATQGAVLAKFREEAKLSYVLSQATLNVVRTIDFGATTAPTGAWMPFAVLEWLDGQSLAQDLAQRRAAGARGRTLAEAMALLEPAARALGLAHGRGIAHRDVKPGNVFLPSPAAAARGVPVKLLDFGIAKIMHDGAAPGGMTATGLLSFTPQYAAPEQIEPRFGASGPWTDVYGLALVLVELLTDRPPFEGSELSAVLAQALDPARRPTPRARAVHVSDAVEAVFARALAVDPRQRFADATEAWRALEAAAAPHAVPTPPPGSTHAYSAPPGMLPPPGPAPPAYAPPPSYLPPAAPHAPRTAAIVAIVLGGGLTLLLLAAIALFIATSR